MECRSTAHEELSKIHMLLGESPAVACREESAALAAIAGVIEQLATEANRAIYDGKASGGPQSLAPGSRVISQVASAVAEARERVQERLQSVDGARQAQDWLRELGFLCRSAQYEAQLAQLEPPQQERATRIAEEMACAFEGGRMDDYAQRLIELTEVVGQDSADVVRERVIRYSQ